jgi:hypothetical protein
MSPFCLIQEVSALRAKQAIIRQMRGFPMKVSAALTGELGSQFPQSIPKTGSILIGIGLADWLRFAIAAAKSGSS